MPKPDGCSSGCKQKSEEGADQVHDGLGLHVNQVQSLTYLYIIYPRLTFRYAQTSQWAAALSLWCGNLAVIKFSDWLLHGA